MPEPALAAGVSSCAACCSVEDRAASCLKLHNSRSLHSCAPTLKIKNDMTQFMLNICSNVLLPKWIHLDFLLWCVSQPIKGSSGNPMKRTEPTSNVRLHFPGLLIIASGEHATSRHLIRGTASWPSSFAQSFSAAGAWVPGTYLGRLGQTDGLVKRAQV